MGSSTRLVASLLLLVSLWGASHRRLDDAACLPVTAGEHDESKHAFAPVAPAEHDHCAVCHWMRSVKPAFTSIAASAASLAHAGEIAAASSIAHRAPAGAQLPARAPPTV